MRLITAITSATRSSEAIIGLEENSVPQLPRATNLGSYNGRGVLASGMLCPS